MDRLASLVVSAVFVAVSLASADAHAQDPDGTKETNDPREAPSESPPKEDDKRGPQDYGGPPRETTTGDVVAWPARVVLFPLWLLENFVVRAPTGALVRTAEQGQWVEEVTSFFTFGTRKQVTIFPSALLDFGLKPSVGFNLGWQYLFADPNTFNLHFGTWGPDWIAVKATDSYAIGPHDRIFVEGSATRRRDNPFSGIGPRTGQDDRTRYASTVGEVAAGYTSDFWRSSTITSRAGLRTLSFQEGGCCGEDSTAQAIAAGRLAAPGFGNGYVAPFQRLELEIDSRRPRPFPGSGIRLEAHEESVFPTDAQPGQERRAWVKYGGSVGAAVDLTGTSRVLGLTVAAQLADPLVGTIPFTDQVTLGGDNLMPGYLRGRLVDRSSVVAVLQYRWPVWVYLDGVINASLGNVYGEHFDGFDVKSSRLSSGLGIRSNGDRESGFEVLFAVASDPLDEGFSISSFRLVFGSHHGF